MGNLEKISNGLNWKVFQKRQLAVGFEYETDDEFIELTYERFQKEWEEVAEISIDQQKLQELWGGDHSHKGGFLFFITNTNPYGEWTQKFSKPFEEGLQLDEESLSVYELDMKTPRARSTSVGDIYQDLDNNLYFMIMSVGFKQVRLKNRIDSDSARAQSKRIQSFPQGFQEANKMWKSILKKEEEEELPIDVRRARERIKQGLPSKEYPLIPQFEDTKMNKADSITDMAFMRGQIKQDLDTIREMVDDSNSLQDLEEMEELVADFVMKLNKEYGR